MGGDGSQLATICNTRLRIETCILNETLDLGVLDATPAQSAYRY